MQTAAKWRMWKRVFLMSLIAAVAVQAGSAHSILFIQAPISGNFAALLAGSGINNPADSFGRGGDVTVRYPDGMIKNLARAVGRGVWGTPFAHGLAVRQPSV